MKIADVQACVLSIPIAEKEFPAPWSWGKFSQVIVEIRTDEGLKGYGESFGYGAPAAVADVVNHALKPLLVGADPADIGSLQDLMLRKTHFFGRYGITTFAISGVDIALWDIAGKRAGVPLSRLWGGGGTKSIPAYASLTRYEDPGQLKTVSAHAKKAGYKAVKLHQLDVESVRSARETVGEDILLTLDVNCPWSPEQALEMCRRLAPFHLTWLEEPIWPPEDFRSLARLGLAGGIPIAAGENACTVFQFRELLEAKAAAYIQPSVIKVGGITEFRKVAALAEAYNVNLAPHSAYFGPGLLATAHLIAGSSQAFALEHFYFRLEAEVFKEPLRFEGGQFQLPDGPGLGLEIDPAVLREYAGRGR